jgi:hypothetical protein
VWNECREVGGRYQHEDRKSRGFAFQKLAQKSAMLSKSPRECFSLGR